MSLLHNFEALEKERRERIEYIGHDYDLVGISDWDKENPSWDIKTRTGFLRDEADFEDLRALFILEFGGSKYAVLANVPHWSSDGEIHFEFYGSRWGPISETGYYSHFTDIQSAGLTTRQIKDYAIEAGNFLVAENAPKKKKPRKASVQAGQLELSF